KKLAQREDLKGKFIFVEGSGIELMQLATQGSDLWVSMPRSTREACGTSDNRAAFGGHLNIATYTGGPAEYIENDVNGWVMDVFADTEYSFDDLVSLLDLFGPGKDAVIETFRSRAQRMLAQYLEQASQLYFKYSEENDPRWLEMMQAAYEISHQKMHILRMAGQYKKVFQQIQSGEVSLEQITQLAAELKDINIDVAADGSSEAKIYELIKKKILYRADLQIPRLAEISKELENKLKVAGFTGKLPILPFYLVDELNSGAVVWEDENGNPLLIFDENLFLGSFNQFFSKRLEGIQRTKKWVIQHELLAAMGGLNHNQVKELQDKLESKEDAFDLIGKLGGAINDFSATGKSAFVGYSRDISQEKADQKARDNIQGEPFSPQKLKEKLTPFIGFGKGKIHFGKRGKNNQEIRELLIRALDNLEDKKMWFQLSADFGRFANFLNHHIYIDQIFSDIFKIKEQGEENNNLTNDFVAKIILLFAIIVHESYHNSRNEGELSIFTENLEAGLRELEVYILVDQGTRKLVSNFVEKTFGKNSDICRTIRSLFTLADSFDREVNKGAYDFYYEASKEGVEFKRGVFTGEGRGAFINDVFFPSRGDKIVPEEIKSFYNYLRKQNNIGNISPYEVGFAVYSICANLSFSGYNQDLREELKRELQDEKMWPTLMESYREEKEFGTAGIRGTAWLSKDENGKIQFLPGPNRINPDTIGRYSLAVAKYYYKNRWQNKGLVLGFDVRNGSEYLAKLTLDILEKRQIKVYCFSQPRPISEIASAVLNYGACGYIYVTASHNPKTDTGFKIGNQLGAQLFKNQRAGIVKEIAATEMFELQPLLDNGENNHAFIRPSQQQIEGEFDRKFYEKIISNLLMPDQNKSLKVLYDPLYGSGSGVLFNLLKQLGYNVELYRPHANFNGDFPTLFDEKNEPLNPDPAEPAVLTTTLKYATAQNFDVVIATDPDADRCGIAVKNKEGNWEVLRANDLWALLVYIRILILEELNKKDKIPGKYKGLLDEGYVILTWVTSDLIEKIARYFGFHIQRPAVGFSKIAEIALDEIIIPNLFSNHSLSVEEFEGNYKQELNLLARYLNYEDIKQLNAAIAEEASSLLLGGFEESNGVSLGGHILEKDGLLAAVVSLEIFEYLRLKKLTAWDGLVQMWREFGYQASVNIPLKFSGPTAKIDKNKVMAQAERYYDAVKDNQLVVLGGKEVCEAHRGKDVAGFEEKGYKFILNDESWLVVRPSGTEAKIRFYGQSFTNPKEFEGRSYQDFFAIKNLEDQKLNDFVLGVQAQIEKEISGGEAQLEFANKINFPILLFDIDNTLAARKENLSKEIGKLLNYFKAAGMVIGIVTGNPLDQRLQKRIKSIVLDEKLIIAANASTQVFYFEKGVARELIDYRKGFEGESRELTIQILEEIIAKIIKGEYDQELSEKLSADELDLLKTIYQNNQPLEVVPTDQLNKKQNSSLRLENRLTRLALKCEDFKTKMDKETSEKIRAVIAEIIRQKMQEYEQVGGYEVRTEGSTTIGIGPVGVSKADALSFIFKNYKAMPEQVVYFGDEFSPEGNDYPVVSISGMQIFSVGEKNNLAPNVNYLGNGPQATLKILEKLKEYIDENGVEKAEEYFKKLKEKNNPYPLPIPFKEQEKAENKLGSINILKINSKSQSTTYLSDTKAIKEFWQGKQNNIAVLLQTLKQLTDIIPNAPPVVDFIITTDLSQTSEKVAACDINSKEVFIHPYFFKLSANKQLEILYHELISHIYKGIRDEAEAMDDTRQFVAAHRDIFFSQYESACNLKLRKGQKVNIVRFNSINRNIIVDDSFWINYVNKQYFELSDRYRRRILRSYFSQTGEIKDIFQIESSRREVLSERKERCPYWLSPKEDSKPKFFLKLPGAIGREDNRENIEHNLSQGHNGAYSGSREQLREDIQASGHRNVTEELKGKVMPAFEQALPKAKQLLSANGLRGPPERIDAVWLVDLGVDYRSVLIDIEGKTILCLSPQYYQTLQEEIPADLEGVLIHEIIEFVIGDHQQALKVERGKPRIGFLHYSMESGGVELVIQRQVNYLVDQGYQVEVIDGKNKLDLKGAKVIEDPKISSSSEEIRDLIPELEKGIIPSNFNQEVNQIREYLRGLLADLDIIIIHNVMTMHFNLALTKALVDLAKEYQGQKRFIAWTHDLTFTNSSYQNWQIDRYPWNIIAKAQEGFEYIAISNLRQKEVSKILGIDIQNVDIIPNGVNFDLIEMASCNQNINDMFKRLKAKFERIAFYPARLVERKNIEMAIKIVAELRKKGVNVCLILTGWIDPHNQSQYQAKLKELIKSLGAEEYIIFALEQKELASQEKLSYSEVLQLYQNVDFLLFSSKSEGFGIPILEAGMLKVPVICSDIKPFDELVDETTGYRFRLEKQISDLADSIGTYFRNQEKVRKNADLLQSKVIDTYNWENIFQTQLEPLLRLNKLEEKKFHSHEEKVIDSEDSSDYPQAHPITAIAMKKAAEDYPDLADKFIQLAEELEKWEKYLADSGKETGPPEFIFSLQAEKIDSRFTVAYRDREGVIHWNIDSRKLSPFLRQQIVLHESQNEEDSAIFLQALSLREKNILDAIAMWFTEAAGKEIKLINDIAYSVNSSSSQAEIERAVNLIHGKKDDLVKILNSLRTLRTLDEKIVTAIEDFFGNGIMAIQYIKDMEILREQINQLNNSVQNLELLIHTSYLKNIEKFSSSNGIKLPQDFKNNKGQGDKEGVTSS
ncbi:MAG: HAD-IIB family hydrolase, partial [Candidatus Omnitrophota bacterium]